MATGFAALKHLMLRANPIDGWASIDALDISEDALLDMMSDAAGEGFGSSSSDALFDQSLAVAVDLDAMPVSRDEALQSMGSQALTAHSQVVLDGAEPSIHLPASLSSPPFLVSDVASSSNPERQESDAVLPMAAAAAVASARRVRAEHARGVCNTLSIVLFFSPPSSPES